jgi:hypothetical protein
MLLRHAEDMRALAVSVATAGVGDEPRRRRAAEREFADLPDAFRALTGFPEPSRYDRPEQRLRDVLNGLSIGDGTANPALHELSTGLRNWTGAAAERFRTGFLQPWPAFVHNQYTVGAVLRSGLLAERELWARARQDADQIAEQGLAAVAACGDCTRTEWSVTFTVVASVAAVAAVPVTGGLSLVAGGIAGLAQVAAATGPSEPPRTSFSADDPVEVADRVREAIRLLLGHIHERREADREALRSTGRLMADRPELFGWR